MRLIFSEPQLRPKSPAIFIDRDGVINRRRPGDYVLDWSQFVFIPGIREALKDLASLKLPMIVISNQAAVGRGMLDGLELENITRKMQQSLLNDGVLISAVYYCTHSPEDKCLCRKPHPQLLHRAAADFHVDLKRSIFIGDSDADVLAAVAAGCRPILFGRGLTACSDSSSWKDGLPTVATAEKLSSMVNDLLAKEHARPTGEINSTAEILR